MTPLPWQRVKAELEALAELDAAGRDQHVAVLRQRDPVLADEVADYLASAPPESFLNAAPARAPLVPGMSLGTYRLEALIGRGGMGEVWRARDTTLDRDVALKVLPTEVAGDPERLARFQREARTLAALNHRSIATIHGIETSGESPALVLELVEGQTLAERLLRGPIPVDEALGLGLQIAEALEAAHAQGVVHRDLKPGNIMVRPDGTVKVLDFGLAKALAPPTATSRRSSAIETAPPTRPGVAMGTPAYMAPEQARGEAVDARADVWAFGAVLYELLTGQRAFHGDSVTDTLAAVVAAEPDWSRLPDLPPLVPVFLKQCLRKPVRDRVHHIADVRLALAGSYTLPRSTAASEPHREAGWRRLRWPVAAAVVAALAVAVGTSLDGGGAPASSLTIRQLTFRQGRVGQARFAPDGQVVVYGASWDGEPYRLFTTRLDGYQSRPIDLPPADLLSASNQGMLAISMSRPSVNGFLPGGLLAQVSLAGGAARALDDEIVGADYGPDGQLAALVRRVGGRSQLEFPVGTVVHTADTIASPKVSPDGRRVCVGVNWGALMLADVGRPAQVLATDVSRIGRCVWHPDGEEVWFSYAPTGATHSNLEAIRPDGSGRRLLAALAGWTSLEDVSSDGTALVAAGSLRYSVHGAAGATGPERDLSVFDASSLGHLDPAGTRVAVFDNSTGARGGALFIRPLNGADAVEIGSTMPVAFTADGAWIATLGEGRAGVSSVITLQPTVAGEPRTIQLPVEARVGTGNMLGTNPVEWRTVDFSDDGQRLLLPNARGADDGQPRVYVHDLAEGWTRPITPEGVTGPVVFSPDGRFVASNQEDGLYVYAVDGGERRLVPGGSDSGVLARWSGSGESVFLFERDGSVAAVVERDLRSGMRRTLREIRVSDPAGVTRFEPWVSRDGTAYAYTLDRILTNLFVVSGLE